MQCLNTHGFGVITQAVVRLFPLPNLVLFPDGFAPLKVFLPLSALLMLLAGLRPRRDNAWQ